MSDIQIINANEGNLRNVTLNIPKNKIVVFTGLSGSGKSTLLMDVLFHECQRQYLEAMSLEGIHKPDVERIRGASPAILITQSDANKNPRSTVGTLSDVYTDLRMIYEKLGVRQCPYCGEMISSADCREETEKIKDDFHVYMYCCKCGRRMDKLTRTHFSFNTKEGACQTCEGLGKIHRVDTDNVVCEDLSLEEGAVTCWEKQYGKYQLTILYAAYKYYDLMVPDGTPVKEFDELQKAILYDGVESSKIKAAFAEKVPPKTTAAGRFEGVLPTLRRRFAEKNGNASTLQRFFETKECPDCRGERLGMDSRSVTVNGIRLPELSSYSFAGLIKWLETLRANLNAEQTVLVKAYLLDVETKLKRFLSAGLGYLSLDRQVVTLSGGELQRVRLAAILDSELSGIIYILDEPTAGLHPKNTEGLLKILRRLRDLENTVLVIEHDIDVMKAADYIIDMGPGSGKSGGNVIAEGTLKQLQKNTGSVTGGYLSQPHPGKQAFRNPCGKVHISHAGKYNLRDLSVTIPTGCLTAVTGPSGSGKSTLIFEVLAKGYAGTDSNRVQGLEQFDQVIEIEQSPVSRMRRSNVATYSDVFTEIRSVFAGTEAAKKSGFTGKHFSFNSPGGRCENCEGLGVVESNMLFFTNTDIICPVCGGNRFSPEILAVCYRGKNVRDVLDLSVDEAAEFFRDQKKISRILTLLQDVGLGYLELGQTLTTLSGGEGQRLKLAKELIGSKEGKRTLYLLDEPTTGLHPVDVEHFLILLDRITDMGNTVVVVEHNEQLIRNSDWVIELGPGGGDEGGQIVAEGRPDQIHSKEKEKNNDIF